MLGIHPTRRISHLGKYTAHNDYPEEEVRRISIAATIFVSAAMLEVGRALALGRVMHVVAYDPEDHDAPNVINEERERERRDKILALHPWSVGWRSLSKTAEKEFLQPMRSECGW